MAVAGGAIASCNNKNDTFKEKENNIEQLNGMDKQVTDAQIAYAKAAAQCKADSIEKAEKFAKLDKFFDKDTSISKQEVLKLIVEEHNNTKEAQSKKGLITK